ncbi:MAG: methyltransferase [Polyangiaceae bacterium]
MPLPDLSRLADRKDLLRDLGLTLKRLGVSLAAAAPIVAAASELPPAQRRPIRAFHLRRMREPRAVAMRLFLFADAITPEEARDAFGDVTPLLDAGLIEKRADGSLVSPFEMSVLDDLYLLQDNLARGEDAVMGFGETTITMCRAAFPRNEVGRVLDLGCGSGTGALLLAKAARVSVGTDINPRAIALARANAALNHLRGVDFRVGDKFAPVAGESFDLIVSQPPFIAQPAGAADATYLYGGRRGDELSFAILSQVVAHLTPGGRAVLLIEWPEPGDGALPTRLRKTLGSGANLLVLRAPDLNIDAHAAAYAAAMHPGLGADFEAEALARREHFEREGIRSLAPTLTIVERTRDGSAGWTATLPTQAFAKIEATSERIDKLLAGRSLASNRTKLLASKLRVPEGTVFAQEQVGPGADVPSTLHARFAPQALLPKLDLSVEQLGLATCVHEAETVRAGVQRLAEMMGMTPEHALVEIGKAAEEALRHGLLEVADV